MKTLLAEQSCQSQETLSHCSRQLSWLALALRTRWSCLDEPCWLSAPRQRAHRQVVRLEPIPKAGVSGPLRLGKYGFTCAYVFLFFSLPSFVTAPTAELKPNSVRWLAGEGLWRKVPLLR